MGFGKSPASMNEYTEDFLNPVSCSTSLIVSSLSILCLSIRLDYRSLQNGTLERLTHEYPNGVPQNPDGNLFLDFLTIETNKMPDNNYEMKIIFAGDSIIKVISEVIEITLDDQGDAWDTKNMPTHKVL